MSRPDLIALMLAKVRRYLDTAEVLRQHGDYDSAVSRLYYAMFYCAQALLRAQGMTFTKHQAVIAAFGRHFAKTKVLPPELHAWLRNAFDRRQMSEYQFLQTATEADVVQLQQKAAELLAQTEAFLKREEEKA